MLLQVASIVRSSSVFSPIRICILRLILRSEPPFARQHMLACVKGVRVGTLRTFTLHVDANNVIYAQKLVTA